MLNTKDREEKEQLVVEEYMQRLRHPLKGEINALRAVIKGADERIKERIKWNAPSYYCKDDLVTFNHRAQQHVHLVFHHPAIVEIHSPLLEGNYKDRRMAYFTDMKAIHSSQTALQSIIKELIDKVLS